MKIQRYKKTDLVCLICGNVLSINRIFGHQKKFGHLKDMYCPYCQKLRKFYEVRDIDIFKWKCENDEYLTSAEVEIMELLKKREKEHGQSEFGVYKKVLKRR